MTRIRMRIKLNYQQWKLYWWWPTIGGNKDEVTPLYYMVNHRWVDVNGDEDVGSDSDDDGEDHLVRNASSETGENQGGK